MVKISTLKFFVVYLKLAFLYEQCEHLWLRSHSYINGAQAVLPWSEIPAPGEEQTEHHEQENSSEKSGEAFGAPLVLDGQTFAGGDPQLGLRGPDPVLQVVDVLEAEFEPSVVDPLALERTTDALTYGPIELVGRKWAKHLTEVKWAEKRSRFRREP